MAWKVAAALILASAPLAHAGLFDDDEARRAILDIRSRLEKLETQSRERAADSKSLNEQVDQLKQAVLELNGQLESLRADNARLRGSEEQLTRNVTELQKKLKDSEAGIEQRISKFEPQKVTLDGREFLADPDEKRQYDEAMATFRSGDFAGAATTLGAFVRRYPASGFSDSARYWLGNAQYGARQYKDAINTFRSLVNARPDSAKAPEALLSVANCQLELKDSKAARATLGELIKTYPKSEAAQAGRDRLRTLR